VAYFKVITALFCLDRLRKTTKTLSKDDHSLRIEIGSRSSETREGLNRNTMMLSRLFNDAVSTAQVMLKEMGR
jgi:hypothetical protein